MNNIASYQEGYTDGYQDGKNTILNIILRIWNEHDYPEDIEDEIFNYLSNLGLIPSKDN